MKTGIVQVSAGIIPEIIGDIVLEPGKLGDMVTFETAVQTGPGAFNVQKRLNDLVKIVQAGPGGQAAENDLDLIHRGECPADAVGGMGMVKYAGPFPPAADCGLADAYFFRQLRDAVAGAGLDKCPLGRSGGRIFVKMNFHFILPVS